MLNNKSIIFMVAAFLAATPIFSLSAERPPLIPVEDFFRNPEFVSFQVSPSGRYIGALGTHRNRLNLFVFDRADGSAQRLTDSRRNNVSGFLWASDDRLLYFMDDDGNESFGIFAINRNGRRQRTLVEPIAAREGVTVLRQTNIIDVLIDDPDHILVVNNDNQLDYPDVFIMNIQNGGRRLVLRNPGNVTGWLTDQSGVVRVGIFSDRDNKQQGILYRERESAPWRELARFGQDAPSWSPIAFDFDEEIIYVSSNLGQDLRGIYAYTVATGELELIYQSDIVDVSGLIMSEFRRSPIGIRYMELLPRGIWFDEEKKDIQMIVDEAFPDTVNIISSMNREEDVMVITSFSDRHAPFYNLFAITPEGELSLTPLAQSRSWLNPDYLSEMRPFSMEARDGMTLHGYIVIPRGSDGKNLPLIVNPHGGPWARDNWGFDPSAQFLANRGFAVLQVNFRASSGFGRKLLRGGDKQWGEAIMDDIYDAVQWAINEGIADPNRIGLYGASFGGYATMMQLVLYPELYQFGINNVGPVELRDLIRHRRQLTELLDFYSRTIGHPEEDRELLAKHSPINFIDRLQAPVFIIHGSLDPRVPVAQADMLRREMRRHNKTYEWLVKTDEGHGFSKENNRIEQYQRIEQFLAPFMDRSKN
jgi:dipeptidyl aminopeptidase/acylaminoacyl peptidase